MADWELVMHAVVGLVMLPLSLASFRTGEPLIGLLGLVWSGLLFAAVFESLAA